jgi:hypothetical protein
MQIEREVNHQELCEKLLTLDPILYSSYLDARGERLGEAIKSLIGFHNELTVMLVPLLPSKDSIVLAAPIGSDLKDIVTKAKAVTSELQPF